MDGATFFNHFDLLADQPDAAAKMRELVLQLAIRGQIVEQLDIEQEDTAWQRFVKSLEDNQAAQEIPPFNVPKQWRWARLDDVADYNAARKVEPSEISEKAWVLDLEEIEKDSGRLLRFTTFKQKQSSSNKAEFVAGDVLYGKLRPYLNKVLVAPKAGFCTTEIVPIRSRGHIVPAYLCLFLRSPHFVAYANTKSYGIKMPRLGTEDAVRAWIPIPPPAEQRRIVVKVDELMGLCVELQSRQQGWRDARARLSQSAFNRLTAAKNPPEFRQRFNFILNRSSFILDEVPQLRQAILQLATQGCLAPQEPEDGTGAETYALIQQERASLADNARVQVPEWPSQASTPHRIPESWKWTTVEGISLKITDGEHLSPKKTPNGMMLLTAKHIRDEGISFENPQYVSLEDGTRFRARCGPMRGDVLICSRGTIGRCTVVETHQEFCLMGSVILVRPSSFFIPRFLAYFLKSDWAQRTMARLSGATAVNALYLKDLRRCPIPLPPLAEQKRIVARVQELMRQCDTLERQLTQTLTLGAHFLDSTLHHLLLE